MELFNDISVCMGKTGQDQYDVTIRFGKYSLRRYARRTNLIDCIPKEGTLDWVDIDIKHKSIEIRLR